MTLAQISRTSHIAMWTLNEDIGVLEYKRLLSTTFDGFSLFDLV